MDNQPQSSASTSAETSESYNKTISGTSESIQNDIINKNILGLQAMLKPFIFKLDESVSSTKKSQESLNHELEELLNVIEQIRKAQKFEELDDETRIKYKLSGDIAADIELKSRQLLGLKRRLTLVHSILQTVNSRVKKLLLTHSSRMNRN